MNKEELEKEVNKLTAESTEWESKFYEIQKEVDRLTDIIDDQERVLTNLLLIIDKADEQVSELLEIARETDEENVNLIDRLELIQGVLRNEQYKVH